MPSCAELETSLQDGLAHLYDPDFVPSETLYRALGCDPQEGALAAQAATVRVIESLKPPVSTPADARFRRIYDVLHIRYVLRMTLEQTAGRLDLSVSSVRRAQREATHALAIGLWERLRASEAVTQAEPRGSGAGRLAPEQDDTAVDWLAQIRQDLASLHAQDPRAVADAGDMIRHVVEVERAVTSARDISLEVRPLPSGLAVAAHPSVLRQTLVMAIGQFVRLCDSGRVVIRADRYHDRVQLTISGPPLANERPVSWEPTQEMLSSFGACMATDSSLERLEVAIELPRAGDMTVLAIDDNPDMVYFYQRCVEGTPYRIVHEDQGRHVFAAVETHMPEVIVLDIMLPDVDGWELLSSLRERPRTRSIPVIVCSVIRESELALALGAVAFLPKPVNHRHFVEALDQALRPARKRAAAAP